jgi:hypothetical protein
VTRIRQNYDWRSPGSALLTGDLMEIADLAMMSRMLMSLKERSESAHAA